MALPKRKLSHARGAKRRTHYKTEMPELQNNTQFAGENVHLRHSATPDGFYKGRRLPGFKD